MDVTREELADLLKETERAHGDYERELGQRDEDWPTWYAGYILDRLASDPRRRARRGGSTQPPLSAPRARPLRPSAAPRRARR